MEHFSWEFSENKMTMDKMLLLPQPWQRSVLLASTVWPSEVKTPEGWSPFYCDVLSLLFTAVTSRQMVDIFKGLSIRLACVLQSTEADTYSAARDWLQHCVSIVKGSYLSLGSTAASCQRQFRRNKKSKRMTVVSVALGILREIEEKTASALLLRGIKRDGSFVYLWHYLKRAVYFWLIWHK